MNGQKLRSKTMDWSKPDWLKKEEKEQKEKLKAAKNKLSKAQKKAAKDRKIMTDLMSSIDANTCDYLAHVAGIGNTKNEITFLASRSKRAGVDMRTAWECSKEFLQKRYQEVAKDKLKKAFDFYYIYE